MFKKSTIRSVLAFVMLIVFALSIMPKRYLHDLFTDHIDMVFTAGQEDAPGVMQNGFNCHCDSLVATSPFTADTNQVLVAPPPDFPTPFTSVIISEYISSPCLVDSRGPPAIG